MWDSSLKKISRKQLNRSKQRKVRKIKHLLTYLLKSKIKKNLNYFLLLMPKNKNLMFKSNKSKIKNNRKHNLTRLIKRLIQITHYYLRMQPRIRSLIQNQCQIYSNKALRSHNLKNLLKSHLYLQDRLKLKRAMKRRHLRYLEI